MEIRISLSDMECDSIESLCDDLKGSHNWQLVIREGDYVCANGDLSFYIQHPDSLDAALMFDISKDEALFLGKTLIFFAESLKNAKNPTQ